MAVALKNILLTDKSLFAIIITAVTYTILIISLIYGIRKHYVKEIIKNPSIFIFLFITLIESVLCIFEKYFPNILGYILPFSYNVIFYINSVIFIIGVIISLIDEKYYTNTFPVTICRMSVYLIGLSVVLIMIEIVYVLLIIIGSVFLITAAVWSAVDFNTFKKNILFWRNRT